MDIQPLLSIVIPSYQSADNLPQTLDALSAKMSADVLEIIVVDCSEDDAVANICALYRDVKLIRCKDRFNPGEGRNIGATRAVGDYLVFIDSDVVLENGALDAIELHARQDYPAFGGALELNKEHASSSSYIEHYYFNHESQSKRPVCIRKNLSSALMVIKKDLFESVKGFSNIPRMQDTELTERLGAMGYKLHFFPDIIGRQIQDSPLKKVFRKVYINGNNSYFLRYAKQSFLIRAGLFLFLPLLMLLKVTRINWRHLCYSDTGVKFLFVFPSMYLCGSIWMLGFYKGMLVSKGISKGR